MSKFFNIYENIDSIDPAELKRAAGLDNPEEVIWPKGKKWNVMLSDTECTVTTSFAGLDGRVYGDLDAFSALSTMLTREEVEARIWKEDPNARSDAAYYAQPEFLPGLPKLTEEEVGRRRAFTAAVLTLLSDQKTMECLAECAPRKKNGLFHKGRVFKIGLTGFADRYSNELLEIVGKSKDETKLTISVMGRNTSPEELYAWNMDFISTYHEGLPISEAFSRVLGHNDDGKMESIESIEPEVKDTTDDSDAEDQYYDHIDEIEIQDKTFVIAGTTYTGVNEAALISKKISRNGGQIKSDISQNTDYLVTVKEKTSQRMLDRSVNYRSKYGRLKIISYNRFNELFNNKYSSESTKDATVETGGTNQIADPFAFYEDCVAKLELEMRMTGSFEKQYVLPGSYIVGGKNSQQTETEAAEAFEDRVLDSFSSGRKGLETERNVDGMKAEYSKMLSEIIMGNGIEYKNLYEGLRVPVATAISYKCYYSSDAEIFLFFTDSDEGDGEIIEFRLTDKSDSPSITLRR